MTTERPWTGGEWSVRDYSDGNKGHIAVTTVIADGREHIADVFPFGSRPGGSDRELAVHRANGTLIAAAPTLFEALEEMLGDEAEWFTEHPDEIDKRKGDALSKSIYRARWMKRERARAALNKALGKE